LFDNGAMKTDYTVPQRMRRYRARKRLGVDAVPLRPPGRPRVDDTPLVENAHLTDLLDWAAYRIEQWLPGGVPLGPSMAADVELWKVATRTKELEDAIADWQAVRDRARQHGEPTRH
jgi:hypothetical protein